MNTENPEKETIIDENTTENSVNEIESATELSIEEKLQEDLANEKDKFLRLFAEFENFKRRTAKERIDLFKTANQDVLQSMLPVLDDFERGLRSMETLQDTSALKEGVNLIFQKFRSILVQRGLEEMSSMHQVFDPELHEAITQVPAQADDMKGKVIDEVEKGYALNGKVIRYAKVVVGS